MGLVSVDFRAKKIIDTRLMPRVFKLNKEELDREVWKKIPCYDGPFGDRPYMYVWHRPDSKYHKLGIDSNLLNKESVIELRDFINEVLEKWDE